MTKNATALRSLFSPGVQTKCRVGRNRALKLERLELRQLLAVQPPALPPGEVYSFELLAKAEPDEWFTGRNSGSTYQSGPYYAYDPDLGPPAGVTGREKVNQDYVWGMAEANGKIFFSSSGNVLSQAGNAIGNQGTSGSMSAIHVSEGSSSQYPSNISADLKPVLGDWRPPRMHVYDTATGEYQDITPTSASAVARLNDTLGLRSVGATDEVVLYAGPQLTYIGMNVFAFDAKTNAYLGSTKVLTYSNIRDWVNVNGQLYTGVLRTFSTTGQGSVLRWTGTRSSPFSFSEVARLDAEGANIAVHNNRLYVSTWPMNYGSMMGYLGYRSNAVASIYVSPTLTSTGRLNSGSWQKVWQITDYEVEPAVAKSIGMGAMASFDGYLYFGTMQVPGTGALSFKEAYPNYTGSTSNTSRSAALFRVKDFTLPDPDVQLLFGAAQLPRFTPSGDATSTSGTWTQTNNNTGPALFGGHGLDDPSNHYIWSMAVAHNRLFVGTFDSSTTGLGSYYVSSRYKGDATRIYQATGEWMGADLWEFFPDTPAGDPVRPYAVSKTGAGNPLNHGIRNMSGLNGQLWLGTANASNLLTAGDNATRYPGYGLKAGGWELVKLNLGGSTNAPPTNLSLALTSPTLPEHSPVGTVVGTLSATDPGDVVTFAITANPQSALKIVGNQLQVADSSALEFTGWPGSVTITVTDTALHSIEQSFTIALDENLPPTDLALTPSAPLVPEHSPAGTLVGILSAVDTDPGETLAYSLEDSALGAFKIDGNQLLVADPSALEYDNGVSRDVKVRVTDSQSQFIEATFTIDLEHNSPPTDLTLALSAPTLPEHTAVDTVVGTLSATDPGDTLTWSLLVNPQGALKIVGNELQVANRSALEYTGWPGKATVRATDSAGNMVDQEFNIALTEVLTPELAVDHFDVQRGATQRSYIRYVDLYFTTAEGLADLLQTGRVELRRYGLTGMTGTGTAVSLTGRLSVIGDRLQMNFGSSGLTTNGFYALSLDLDGDGTRETTQHFYRLLGDVNGDKTANSADRSLVWAAIGKSGTNLNEDMNGSGSVSYIDYYMIRYASGSLASSLWPELDD